MDAFFPSNRNIGFFFASAGFFRELRLHAKLPLYQSLLEIKHAYF